MLFRRTVVALCSVAIVACSAADGPGTDTTAVSAEVSAAAGTYSLQSANGTLPLAYPKTAKQCVHSIVGGTLTLISPQMSYTLLINAHSVCDAPSLSGQSATVVDATPDESGTWNVSNGVLVLSRHQGSTVSAGSGAIAGNTASVPATVPFTDSLSFGAALVFKK